MSLPTEILQLVIEDFISQHPNRQLEWDPIDFVPQWYLTPLLRVCRLWHEVTEAYLYREISNGSKIWHPILRMKGESVEEYHKRHATLVKAMMMKRSGHEIAEDLLASLTTSSRLAALVRTLRLGIEIDRDSFESIVPKWTRTNIHILQLCRNVEHVEIRGYEHAELDALVEALKDTSLITFKFSMSKQVSTTWPPCRRIGRFTQLFDLIRSWPRLRSIRMEEFLADKMEDDSMALDVSQDSRCPDLEEIILPGAALHDFEFRALRSICGNVSKLSTSLLRKRVDGRGNAAVETLYECLSAWSSSLEYLKLDVPDDRHANQRLTEAIISMRALRELQITNLKLDLASISKLPRLERFATFAYYKWEEVERLLEDSGNFPSLICIAVEICDRRDKKDRMRDVCARRNIELHKSLIIDYDEEYDPAPEAGFLL